ncbi:MAG: ABC transporter permease, partial [Microthrixaceae bacterium]|nr:ABC transporter permease [Microthrixaceae bacterium]
WAWSNFSSALSDNSSVLIRSFVYAGAATVACILIGYPLAYFVAFRGGKYRNLVLGLIVLPFYTSFLIRTLAWKSLFADHGPIVGALRAFHLTGALEWVGLMPDGRFLNTSVAVIGGLTYNFLAFMILPIYVSLEKIDPRLLDAAQDLYSTPAAAFRKVVLPLSMPGVFAGTLLTFIPAAGDFINAELLGGPNNAMIGKTIKDLFLTQSNYPTAAALSLVFMVVITAGVLLYAKLLGTEDLAG